jgi:hypothetical protein
MTDRPSNSELSDTPAAPPSGPVVMAKPETCPVPPIWRRLGAAAFLFFLIKGLLWLIIPGLIAMGWMSSGD